MNCLYEILKSSENQKTLAELTVHFVAYKTERRDKGSGLTL